MMAQHTAPTPLGSRRDGDSLKAKTKEVLSLTKLLTTSTELCEQLNAEKLKIGNECKESKKAIMELQKVINKATKTKEADGSQTKQIKALEARAEKAEGKLATAEAKFIAAEAKFIAAEAKRKTAKINTAEANSSHEKEINRLKQAVKDSGTEFKSLNSTHGKSVTQVGQLQKQVHDLEQKVVSEGMAHQNQLKLQSTLAEVAGGSSALASQLVKVKEENVSLLAQVQKHIEECATKEGLLRKAQEAFDRLDARLLKSDEAANVELEKEKDSKVLVSKTAKKTAKINTKLQSQLARLHEKNTVLEASSVTISGRCTELLTKYKKYKKDSKRATSELRDRVLLDQVLQDKIKNSELQIKNAEDSASKHKTRAKELHERLKLELGEGFRQQDPVEGYSTFASPPTNRGGQGQGFRQQDSVGGYSKIASPPTNRGGQGHAYYRFSPVPMSPLTPDDDTRSPTDLKKVGII